MSTKPPSKKPVKKADVTWGQRPSVRAQAVVTGPAQADSFVQGAKGQTIRLNLNIPRTLHARIKSQCALQGRNMTDAVMELLETHFPQPKGV